MEKFRKLYYKLATIFCMVVTFVYIFNTEAEGVGNACLYIFSSMVCFGALSVGKERIDPKKPIRNVLLYLGWSILGFGMMCMGIVALTDHPEKDALLAGFLVMLGFGLVIVYLISIIMNKDWWAIISVALFVGGFVAASNSNGDFVFGLFSLIIVALAIAAFVISIIRGIAED